MKTGSLLRYFWNLTCILLNLSKYLYTQYIHTCFLVMDQFFLIFKIILKTYFCYILAGTYLPSLTPSSPLPPPLKIREFSCWQSYCHHQFLSVNFVVVWHPFSIAAESSCAILGVRVYLQLDLWTVEIYIRCIYFIVCTGAWCVWSLLKCLSN